MPAPVIYRGVDEEVAVEREEAFIVYSFEKKYGEKHLCMRMEKDVENGI
ncbi:MAG: hypothetical protein HFH89_10285 [Lachnospiraceae bacterium]|nr:hypothetical protein [Lachnospiraceae bacterium]